MNMINNTNTKLIIDRFKEVEKLGFVPSNRKNNTGIGKTFEDYVGVVENNLDEPDLYGFEIKSHREMASSYVTLFTKAPSFPKRANAYLKDKYGTEYEDNPDLKKLHASMFANKKSLVYDKYNFKLINDRENEVVLVGVYDPHTNELIDSSVGYTYKCLNDILQKKLKNLFYVSADSQIVDNKEHFHFNRAEIFTQPSLEKLLQLIDDGVIMYDIRIGSYHSGSKYGKPHDHGSGIRILEKNIHLLYEHHMSVK